MFDVSKSQGVERKISGNHKQELIDSETQKEEEWRDKQHDQAVKRVTGWAVSALIGLAFIMGSLYLGITSFRKSQYKGDVEYNRDLPYMSPAAAARMNDVGGRERVIFDFQFRQNKKRRQTSQSANVLHCDVARVKRGNRHLSRTGETV